MRTRNRTWAIATIAAVTAAVYAQPIRIDGEFDDWAGVPVSLTDPSGDASGAFDLTRARAISAGTVVYVEFDSGSVLNLAAGPGSNRDIFVRFFLSGSGTNVYVQMHDPNRVYVNTSSSTRSWASAGFAAAPTFASDRFEMRIDLALVGAQPGDDVQVSFGANGTASTSSDDSAGSIPLTLGGDNPEPHSGSVTPDACANWRLASLNVLTSGLTDGEAGIEAMVDAVDADIYCFQEEYGASASQVQAALNAIDPKGDGIPWNVHLINDNIVASQQPLIALPSFNSKYSAAIVDGGSPETSIAVLSIHPKCCGFIGSSEDNQRINETTGMVMTIENLRNAPSGSALEVYRDVPIVIAGDWNLVGSRTPLDMLTAPAIPGLVRLALPKPGSDDHATWRSLSSSSNFAPGQLDLIVYDAEQLHAINAFVLDTQTLPAAQLAELGLGVNDSRYSDHLMMVADLSLRNPADLAPPQGVLDFSDVHAFLAAFGAQDPAADLSDPEGVFDFSDVLAFLGAFGTGCP